MSIAEAIVRIRFIGKKQVTQIGNVSLVETTFKIGRLSQSDENTARISYQHLLPSSVDSDFVTIKEASKKTKLSATKLRKLCRDEIITSEKRGGKWRVHLPSLYSYLSKK